MTVRRCRRYLPPAPEDQEPSGGHAHRNSFRQADLSGEDIPLVRVGFPITDRANLHYFPIIATPERRGSWR